MSDALPAEIAVKLALTTRLTDAYVTLDAAELSTWQAWTAAHNPTIAAPVPAVAPPTAGTHPDSPETSESRTAPLPPPVVPRCDGCRWSRGHGSAENPRWVIRTVKGIDRDALLTLAPGITVIEQRCTLCGRTDIDHTPGKVSLAEKETP